MTTKKYASAVKSDLLNQCASRGIAPAADATKAALVEALEKADAAEKAAKNAPKSAADFGDLPPVKEAPDAYEPPAAPPANLAPTTKIPPDPIELTPENTPAEPEVYKLTNDIFVPQNGLPVRMLAGKLVTSVEYDLGVIKAAGGVLVPKRVFDKKR